MKDFYTYEWCPRMAGGLDEHRQKDLHHVWVMGRMSCVMGEAFYQLREQRVPMGYFPRERLPL